ncbi:hypothetical protein MKK75_06100, partial [Methylobacterium sp. J-030]|uniref:hypothetical protein n=1 Tax=Methylobacterium sp. J-030 TaxID=2836627 RepID=UPI001FBB6137
VLAVILWPWIDAIEAVRPGMADPLQKTAEKSVRDLRHLIIVTAPLETMLRDALQASGTLARNTAGESPIVATARMDALLALSDLIAWLRCAKPSEWARAAGIRW